MEETHESIAQHPLAAASERLTRQQKEHVMNKINFPLKRGMQDAAVADLQDALQQCLDRGVFSVVANDELTRRKWSAALQSERAVETSDDVIAKLVSHCYFLD
jgi:hypothetical protein